MTPVLDIQVTRRPSGITLALLTALAILLLIPIVIVTLIAALLLVIVIGVASAARSIGQRARRLLIGDGRRNVRVIQPRERR